MPKFTHDCSKCQFLGTEHDHDLYICATRMIPGLGPSIIARFENDGPDYTSMPWGTIETYLDQCVISNAIMAAVRAVEEVMVNTLKVRSNEFNQFLYEAGSADVLAQISRHANQALFEELTAPGFPYDPQPFLALRAVALLRGNSVTFALTAKEA